MLIFLTLFVIVIVVSFILAYISMRSYLQIPNSNKIPYSAFLIRKDGALNSEMLDKIYNAISLGAQIISFERLYKGNKKALVIFGPSKHLLKFQNELDLIEIEDYSQSSIDNDNQITSFEISSKGINHEMLSLDFTNIVTDLTSDDEIWWQIVAQPTKSSSHLNSEQTLAKIYIRLVIKSIEKLKNKHFADAICQNIKNANLLVLPQAYSSTQILKFYKERSLPQNLLKGTEGSFEINFKEVKKLIPA